jgi:hypothetical protein
MPTDWHNMLLNSNLLAIQHWLKRWRMKVNETKSTHVTFTMRSATCPLVHINGVQLHQSDDVKYLGLHLDIRLTWHKHIFTKRKQLGFTLAKMQWLLRLSPNSPPPTNYSSIKQYSNLSGPMVYNSGALLPPPTLKSWNDSNLRSCTWLWTPPGTSLIHSSKGASAALQSKKKSVVLALTMVIDFATIPIISQ